MVLFVQDGCTFCKDLTGPKDMLVLRVVDVAGRPRLDVGSGHMIPLPAEVRGLPALLIGSDLIIGRAPITKKLEELANAPA